MFTSDVGGEIAYRERSPPIHRPDDPSHDKPAFPYPDQEAQCPCGARPEDGDLCRKCQARAAWVRRHTPRGNATPNNGAYDPKPFRSPRTSSRRPRPAGPKGRGRTDRGPAR